MRECNGVVWGFSWLGATCWRFCRKTQKEPAKCLYSVLYSILCTVYSFPPCGWNLCQAGRQFLSVAGWGREGEWGNFVSIALHSLSLPGPGGESREGGCVPSPCSSRDVTNQTLPCRREGLVSDIPAGTGKPLTFFYSVPGNVDLLSLDPADHLTAHMICVCMPC